MKQLMTVSVSINELMAFVFSKKTQLKLFVGFAISVYQINCDDKSFKTKIHKLDESIGFKATGIICDGNNFRSFNCFRTTVPICGFHSNCSLISSNSLLAELSTLVRRGQARL